MAAAAAKILGGVAPNTRCQHVSLPNKLYSLPSKSKLLHSTIIHPQSTKFGAFSVRACSRANNNKLLPYVVRKRRLDAIEFSGRRVTIDVVATKDNFKLSQAQIALQALAGDTNYPLQMATSYLMRVSFFLPLAASNVVRMTGDVFLAIILRIIGSPRAEYAMATVEITSNNLCSASLIPWIFSYVFGDGNGDPNQGIEERRWEMIKSYISINGSVVTAEEIAPYLDLETTGKMNDESYMLPVLQKLDGQPKVDEEGDILYHFPSLPCSPLTLRTSGEEEYAGRRGRKVDKFLMEKQWIFSKYGGCTPAFVVNLLYSNLFYALLSSFILRVTLGRISNFSQYLFLPLLLPVYSIYAVSFLIISSIRRSSINKRNAKIVKRNEAREECAKSLESPDPSLMKKLLSARTMARRHRLEVIESGKGIKDSTRETKIN